MTIRSCSIADRQACLDILDGNTRESFVREDLALPDGYGPAFDRVTMELQFPGNVVSA